MVLLLRVPQKGAPEYSTRTHIYKPAGIQVSYRDGVDPVRQSMDHDALPTSYSFRTRTLFVKINIFDR